MAIKFACDHSNVVAAIADLAGATFYDWSMCKANSKVNVLRLNGTLDYIFLYEGGEFFKIKYPSAS